jgi:zinc protease
MEVLNRQIPPPIKDAVDFQLQLKPYQQHTLRNGVPVYVVDAGAEDVVQIEWVFDAGNVHEQKNLLASTTNFLLKNGTSTQSAFEINSFFEYYGAYLNRNCYTETASVTLHCLSKHLHLLLPAVASLLTDAQFPEEEIQIQQQNSRQRLSVNLKKCDFVANRLIDAYMFGESHPYGRYTTEEAIDAIERKDLLAFYEDYYKNGRLRIFIAGKLPIDYLTQIESAFGSQSFRSKPNERILPAPLPSIEPGHLIQVENDPAGVQGAIRLARLFPSRLHPDYLQVQVLNALLGGFFGSRLMENIREEKGYTYGIHSYLQAYQEQSVWTISTEAGRDVCMATIDEVWKEMEILREELVEEDELLLVKNYIIGTVVGDLDGPFHILGRWKNMILGELGEDYFEKSIQAIKSIDAIALQRLAKQYLQPNDFYQLVVV